MALFAAAAPAQTYLLQSKEYTVTSTAGYGHSTPIIGQDSIGSSHRLYGISNRQRR
jgi:hypothetical protein